MGGANFANQKESDVTLKRRHKKKAYSSSRR